MTSKSRVTGAVLVGVLVIGAVANRAALRGPLALDDFAQRAMIEGTLTPARGPLNLYDFIADDNRTALMDRGAIPWWSDPRLVIRFLRPLPSALVWLDHRLFGYGSFGPHLLSLLWWVAAVLAAHALYRTALAPRPALVAAAVFALSPTLAIPMVWLANRDTLVSLTFGALALALYIRWRRDRRRASGFGSAAAFGATMLTGEYAICLAGYVVAFEIFHRNEPYRRRITGALPVAVPLVLYAIVHAALGYGATASGFYRNPIADPSVYLGALPRAIPALLASAWLGIDETSSWLASQPFRVAAILGGALLVFGTIWSARRDVFNIGPESGAWLACGSVFALLPLAATEPSRRILGVAALGVSGALGILIAKGTRALTRPLRPSVVAGVAGLCVVGYVHLIAAPLETRRLSRLAVAEETYSLARLLAVRRPPDHLADTILVLRATQAPTVLWTPFLLRADAPKHWWVLSQTLEQTAAIRISPSSVEVVEEQGPIFATGPTDILRTVPFRVGDMVQIPGLRAAILRVDDEGRPKVVRYEFERNLDDADVAWISEGRSGFGDVAPPPVGMGVRLAP